MASRFFGRFKEQMKDEDCLPELVSLEIEESDDDVEAEGMQKDQSINELKSLATSFIAPEPSWVRSAYGDNIDEKEETLPELVAKITVKPLSDCIVDEYEEDKMILLPCNNCHKIKKTNRCSNCKSVYYCGVQCQKNDWTSHKYACERLKKVVIRKSKNDKKPKENSETEEKIVEELRIRKALKEAVIDTNVNVKVVEKLLESLSDKNPRLTKNDQGDWVTLLELAANYGRMDIFEHVSCFVDQNTFPNFGEIMRTAVVQHNVRAIYM